MRWFKGYRDAQVAFITSGHEGSTVVFLAIFAPRRSLLEVWPLMVYCNPFKEDNK